MGLGKKSENLVRAQAGARGGYSKKIPGGGPVKGTLKKILG